MNSFAIPATGFAEGTLRVRVCVADYADGAVSDGADGLVGLVPPPTLPGNFPQTSSLEHASPPPNNPSPFPTTTLSGRRHPPFQTDGDDCLHPASKQHLLDYRHPLPLHVAHDPDSKRLQERLLGNEWEATTWHARVTCFGGT